MARRPPIKPASEMTEEEQREHARIRIWGETIEHSQGFGSDGTVTEDGRVVKLGSRAIVDKEGRIIGVRPE